MNLQPISVDFLKPGTLIDFPVYSYINGVQSLLCKDVVMTESMHKTLKRSLEGLKNVYIDSQCRDIILKNSHIFNQYQEAVEIKVEYNSLTNSSHGLIDDALKYGSVSYESATNIVEKIYNKINMQSEHLLIDCINTVRDANEYLYTHCINVGFLNGLIGKWLLLEENTISDLIMTGFVHDMGKLLVPDSILNKPAKLTDNEFEIIKNHPKFGVNLLIESGFNNENVLIGVYEHHEKINGTGYPRGLTQNQISQFGKITAISDVYDAMINKRVYKNAHSPFEIMEQIFNDEYSHLDVKIAKIFLQRMPMELIGKLIVLSDGSIARIEHIDPNDLKHPIVSINEKRFKTGDNLSCVRMYIDL